jgi:hypothetical protein
VREDRRQKPGDSTYTAQLVTATVVPGEGRSKLVAGSAAPHQQRAGRPVQVTGALLEQAALPDGAAS